MFGDESHDQFEIPREEVSLNFTVTGHSSKQNKKEFHEASKMSYLLDSTEIFNVANS